LQRIGGERVQIMGLTQRLPYLVATVSPHPLMTSLLPPKRAVPQVTKSMPVIGGQCNASSATRVVVEPLPSDEVTMSWHLAQRMQVDDDRKQAWLTAMSATQRLRSMIVSLRAEARTLPLTTPRVSTGEQWSWN
jgi:hypothetical protein